MITNSSTASGAADKTISLPPQHQGCEVHIEPHPTRPERLTYHVTFDGKVIAQTEKSFRDHTGLIQHASGLIDGLFKVFPTVTLQQRTTPTLTLVTGGRSEIAPYEFRRAA